MPLARRTRRPAWSTASRDRGGRAGRSRAETLTGRVYAETRLTRTAFVAYGVRERCSSPETEEPPRDRRRRRHPVHRPARAAALSPALGRPRDRADRRGHG